MLVGFGFVVYGNLGGPLGLRCSAASDYLRERFHTVDERGCVVLRVSAAADHAGMRQGDLMIEMNGIPIVSGAQFGVLFDDAEKDRFVFTVLRPGVDEPLDFEVDMGDAGRRPATDKDDPLFYYLRARWDAADGAVEGPINDYNKAIEIEPRFDLAYLYRGALYQKQGALDAARDDYRMALELSPNLAEAHRFYAQFAYGESMAHILRAIDLDGCADGFTRYNVDCAEDFRVLASIQGQSGMTGEFPRSAERAIEYYPGFPEPYYIAAVGYKDLGDIDKARAYAEQYLEFPRSEVEESLADAFEEFLAATEASTQAPPTAPSPVRTPP
jgi:hypothetical protein